jgi:eukaryotic-like serine/threonine-protein kinase
MEKDNTILIIVGIVTCVAIVILLSNSNIFSSMNVTGAVAVNTNTEYAVPIQSADNLLLIGSGDNYLYTFDADTGELVWKAWAIRDIKYMAPAVYNNKVYIGSRNRWIQAFDLLTGDLIWKHKATGRIYGAPVLDNDVAYVGAGNGILYALDANTGDTIWEYQTGTDQLASDIYSTPVLHKNALYVSAYDGLLYAINKEGELEWTFETEGKLYASIDQGGDALYLTSADSNVYAIDPILGTELWHITMPENLRTSPVYRENMIYVAGYKGTIYAISTETQKIRWETPLDARVEWSNPTVYEDMLYVGAHNGNLYALDTKTGNIEWTFDTEDHIYSSPVVENNILYVGIGRSIYAFNPKTGEELWSYETGSTISSTATVVSLPNE